MWRLQVWSLDTLQRVKTLTGHTDAVRALAVSNGKLFSGSYDGSVKVPPLLSSPVFLHSMKMIALIASCIERDGGQLASVRRERLELCACVCWGGGGTCIRASSFNTFSC